MSDLRFSATRQRTDKTLRILDQGSSVSALQQDLTTVGFVISDDEIESGSFGSTTHRSVIRFQRQQGLAENGIVDTRTLNALKAIVNAEYIDSQRDNWRRSIPTLRETSRLNFNLLDSQQSSTLLATELQNTRTSKLKKQLLDMFDQPSDQLATAINSLSFNLDEVTQRTFSEFVYTEAIPALMRDESLHTELFRAANRGLNIEDASVSDMLGLKQDARDDDALRDLTNRARNAALGDIAGLDDDTIQTLADHDLSQNADTIFRLADTGAFAETQRDQLLFAADLARLADDNFDAVRALMREGVQASRELVNRDRSDWLRFIETNDIAPPKGDTVETFAAVIDKNIELAFPTDYAMTRFAAQHSQSTLARIDVLARLPESDNPLFIDSGVRADIDLSALPDTEAEAISADLAELGEFANRYAGLGVKQILNDSTLPARAKRTIIQRRQAALAQAWSNRPELDLHLANFSPLADPSARAFTVELDDIEADDRPFVRSALMSIQRTLRLSDGYAEADRLLASGLDSATKIAALDDAEEFAMRAGLDNATALRIRARAIETRTRMLHTVHSIEETSGHAPFLPAILREPNSANTPGGLVNVLQDLPGYADLFGPQNYCKCAHCQSIFSPAAYFVDLMQFIDKKISRSNFINPGLTDHPLYLRNRREDLWHLSLTCENTDTPVRYVEIVNEVLANYLETADPLEGNLIENLATQARSSFQQPVNLPHAAMLMYLKHLGVDLKAVSALFDSEHTAATHTKLDISPQELATITGAATDAVRQRFRKPFSEDLSVHETPLLTQLADVDRQLLGRLLATDFVLGNIEISFEITTEGNDDLIGFMEYLHLTITDTAAEEPSFRGFLDRLHRLTRLQRVLGWTPEELQMVIDSLSNLPLPSPDSDPANYGDRLDGELLDHFANIKLLTVRFDLSVSEALALCDRIPTVAARPGAKPLWIQLFSDQDQITLRHPRLGNTLEGENEVSPGFGILQGALQISEHDLINTIIRVLPTTVIQGGVVDIEHLHALYRSARLADALDISQSALGVLTGILPDLLSADSAATQLSAIFAAIDIVDRFARLDLPLDNFLSYLDAELISEHLVARAVTVLEELHDTLGNSGDRIWVTPVTLAQIEGMTPESARAVIQNLLDTEPVLIQPDANRERYLVADSVILPPDSPRLLAALSVAGGPLHLTGDDHSTTFLLEAVRQQLLQRVPWTLAADGIATALNISVDTLLGMNRLFEDADPMRHPDISVSAWLSADMNPPARLTRYVAELLRLQTLLIDTFTASDLAIQFISNRASLFAISPLSLDGATEANIWQWESLWRVGVFIQLMGNDNVSPEVVTQLLDGWSAGDFAESSHIDLAQMLGLTLSQIELLLSSLPPDSNVFHSMQRLEDAVVLTDRIGLDPASLRQLTVETFAAAVASQDLLLGAIRRKYTTEAGWQQVADKFTDKVETKKRDTLVDRILSRRELGFESSREIYHVFLLDPEMDGCFTTSRVKNAISTCQLYVQRCLMGLEKSVATENHSAITVKVKKGKKSRQEWQWRKNYRVWEANRKVFLYPENYMLPDLRDDRTHIFKEAESNLLQGTLDATAIERVFQRYLSDFVEVGNIKVVSTLLEKGEYILFGRTQASPYRYFTRRFNGEDRWQPWEPIDLDIGAKNISAVTRRGKLYIFWTNVALDGDAGKAMAAQEDIKLGQQAQEEENANEDSSTTTPIMVSYTFRDEKGRWSSPQDFLFYTLTLTAQQKQKNKLLPFSDQIYAEFPHPSGSTGGSNSGVDRLIRLIHPLGKVVFTNQYELRQYLGFLDESENRTINRNGSSTNPTGTRHSFNSWAQFKTPGYVYNGRALWQKNPKNSRSTANVDYLVNHEFLAEVIQDPDGVQLSSTLLEFPGIDQHKIRLRSVGRSTQETVLQAGDLQYLIKITGQPGIDQDQQEGPDSGSSDWWHTLNTLAMAKWKLVNLSSTYPLRSSEIYFSEGLDKLLSPEQQSDLEPTSTQSGLSYPRPGMIRKPDEDYGFRNIEALLTGGTPTPVSKFDGVHGSYLWELYFHLPFQIAHSLNSAGKFEEAHRCFQYIFDPTTADSDDNAHWRFVVFRTLKEPMIRAVLSDRAAIKKYKKDPFNPFAISRLRPSAFQKNVVMRFIDNLLDWGDSLFRTDTRESNNEAMLLYVMAADLLGERPIQTAECEVAENFTFNDIQQRGTGSEFLVELENLSYFFVGLGALLPVERSLSGREFVSVVDRDGSDNEPAEPPIVGSAFSNRRVTAVALRPYNEVQRHVLAYSRVNVGAAIASTDSSSSSLAFESRRSFEADPTFRRSIGIVQDDGDAPDRDGPILENRQQGFCVPPNATLLGYWDRVEDRLYKLRHCMNIEGVVRELPLWQPPIDPLLLIRAKAAGIELDDVLAMTNDQPPQHRFEVLLERARRFTNTAQEFGNRLLSALERRDDSELTLIRSTHERTILNLVRQQKLDVINEAKKSRAQLESTGEQIKARIEYYQLLVGSDETKSQGGDGLFAMNDLESNAITSMLSSKEEQTAAGKNEGQANRYREIGPQWTAGGSLSTGKLDGRFFRVSADTRTVWGSANIEARFQRRAFRHRDASQKHNSDASTSSTFAGHLRRVIEWKYQLQLSNLEKATLEKQLTVADIRIALAENDLEAHDKQIENSREIYEFSKDRFTNLGLYSYLSTTLSRLHRESYDLAFKMAQTAERAYRFEIGEDTLFVKLDNWTFNRAGLLAADRLLLQLQAMEAAYVERDRRRQEVILACPFSQIVPDALLNLRHTGRAQITIPEWWFDLHYPGQYRRMLSAVRLTIPCVTGPYNNVAAKLTLIDSAIRATADASDESLVGVQIGRNTSISTSSAKSDPGVFELRFDGPKNPPFKGAGAVSSWVLEFPSANRVFNYASISDAILELSYTAENDGLLGQTVMGDESAAGVIDSMLENGIVRVISLRHQYSDIYHQLLTRASDTEPVELTIDPARVFPYWVGDRTLEVMQIDFVLEPGRHQVISIDQLQNEAAITFNGERLTSWQQSQVLGMLPMTTLPLDSLSLVRGGVNITLKVELPDMVEISDVFIRLTCRAQ